LEAEQMQTRSLRGQLAELLNEFLFSLDPPANKTDVAIYESKVQSPQDGDAGNRDLIRQVADLKVRLEAKGTEIIGLRGQLTEQVSKLRTAETENERLRPELASLRQDLRAVQMEKEKQTDEAARLGTLMKQIGQDRAGMIEAGVKNRTAQLQGDLGEALRKLQVVQGERERFQKQVDVAAKSDRAAKEALEKLQNQIRALSDRLRVKQRENERLQKELANQNRKGIGALSKPH
jgi:chromosome segregation ATPase